MFKYYVYIFIKSFTFRRFHNILKSHLSYLLSIILKTPIVWGYPPIVMIEPTNFCNLKCPLCPSGSRKLTRPRGFMELDLYKNIIDQIKKDSFMVLLWNQGEPFLHINICEMIKYAAAAKMIVGLSTNANVMPDINDLANSGLDELILSIDGITQDTYNKYRINGSLDTALKNIKNLIEKKTELKKHTPRIVGQFIVMKHNEHEINEAKKLFKKIKIDKLALKTVQIYSKEDIYNFLPSNPKYQRYKIKNDHFSLKFGLKNRCYRIWNQPVINWDGEMAVCCYDKDNVYRVRNWEWGVGSSLPAPSSQLPTIKTLWKSRNFMTFRKNILKNRHQYEICRNCGEGVKLRITNHKSNKE